MTKRAIHTWIALFRLYAMNHYFFKNIELTFDAFGPSE